MQFYNEDEMLSQLTCQRCHEIYKDPRRLVPCSETICQKCIRDLSAGGRMKCFFCQCEHEIPANGFKPCQATLTLLNIYANRLNRIEVGKEMKLKLEEIGKLTRRYETDLDSLSATLGEYCSALKTKINATAEVKLDEIRKVRDEMLRQVDVYQDQCNENVTLNRGKLTEVNFESCNQFVKEWTKYLKNFQIDETILKEQFRLADKHLNFVREKLKLLKSIQFNGVALEFNENRSRMSSNKLGKFSFDDLPSARGSSAGVRFSNMPAQQQPQMASNYFYRRF
jgi:hypothetical protein